MSANDILDVLNIQRDDASQPAKKRQKLEQQSLQKGSGMARELYNLLGPNTPPVSINLGGKRDRRQKVSPWTRMPFKPNKKSENSPRFSHWEKGSKELLESTESGREYFFDKFSVAIDIPEMVDELTFDSIMAEIRESEREKAQEREKQKNEKARLEAKAAADKEKKKISNGENSKLGDIKKGVVAEKSGETGADKKANADVESNVKDTEKTDQTIIGSGNTTAKSENTESENSAKNDQNSSLNSGNDTESTKEAEDESESGSKSEENAAGTADVVEETDEKDSEASKSENSTKNAAGNPSTAHTEADSVTQTANDTHETDNPAKSPENTKQEWSYAETKTLFQYCKDFELKWHIINDRYPGHYNRSMEDLKEQFYRVSAKILKYQGTGNPGLLESLDAFSKAAEIDRKQYLESLLKRTPAEIAEEESLVIEARRFELAAKKMLVERSNLLTLLDSPQSSQSVQQYQSSQGLTNLYNNLMILDKHQKKKMQQKANNTPADPVPPQIPPAASSSHKRDRAFQTHLQQYLAGVLKQQGPAPKGSEPSPIQQLLAKRLTEKEEEAYGLHYHANERLTPGVILRSTQKLPGLQQRQSVFKAVNGVLQELEIPTAGGTAWKPNMPTRKTMAKYDELVRTVVALLDVKKGKDKLEAEIALMRGQQGLQ